MTHPNESSRRRFTEQDIKHVAPIQPQPGNADDPVDFVGRRDVDEYALQRLRSGSNLLLTDPRRMGKIYWMKHLCAITDEYRPVYIDYEGVTSSEGFLIKTASSLNSTALPNKVMNLLTGIFGKIDKIDFKLLTIQPGVKSRSALELLTMIIDQLNAPDDNGLPWLICMDEVPLAILNISRYESPEVAGALLQTLRSLRTNSSNIRWIVGGSIGFHHVLLHAKSTEGELNDLLDLPLGPLDPIDASELSCCLVASFTNEAEPGTIDAMVECSDGIAHYLHAIAEMLANRKTTLPITPAMVRQAFQDYIEDPDRSRSSRHYEERIDEYFGEDSELAKAILDYVASGQTTIAKLREAVTAGNRFSDVLYLLQRDHYLRREGEQIRWRYEPLRLSWSHGRLLDI